MNVPYEVKVRVKSIYRDRQRLISRNDIRGLQAQQVIDELCGVERSIVMQQLNGVHYTHINEPMSERNMQRLVHRFIYQLAERLNEI